jgi:hypothetical protein
MDSDVLRTIAGPERASLTTGGDDQPLPARVLANLDATLAELHAGGFRFDGVAFNGLIRYRNGRDYRYVGSDRTIVFISHDPF